MSRFLWWLSGNKEYTCDAGDVGLIPGWRRSLGEGNCNPLQHSGLGNPTEEPGRLQSMGSQGVGHNLVTNHQHTKYLAAAAAAAKSLQSYPILCDPIDGSPPGTLSLGFSRQEHWSGLPFPSPMHES